MNSTKDTNTMDGDFMRKTKINGNAISQTLKRKKTLNEDLPVANQIMTSTQNSIVNPFVILNERSQSIE